MNFQRQRRRMHNVSWQRICSTRPWNSRILDLGNRTNNAINADHYYYYVFPKYHCKSLPFTILFKVLNEDVRSKSYPKISLLLPKNLQVK
jgi:hypothetical protein